MKVGNSLGSTHKNMDLQRFTVHAWAFIPLEMKHFDGHS